VLDAVTASARRRLECFQPLIEGVELVDEFVGKLAALAFHGAGHGARGEELLAW
jgi:hypothetical protein